MPKHATEQYVIDSNKVQLAKTAANTNYHEILKTSVTPANHWLMVIVDVFNSSGTTSNMEYGRYKINMTTGTASAPTSLAAAKVYGDTLISGVLTAVANADGTLSLWGKSNSAVRTVGLTFAYTMVNSGNLLGYTHPLTSSTTAPTGTFTVVVS